MNPIESERPVSELFRDLARETGTLVRQEVKLATTEMSDKAAFAGKQAAVMAGGALLGVVALLTLVAALVLGIGAAIPLWGAALIVGAVLAIIAGALAAVGAVALKHFDFKPRQTAHSIQEMTAWAQAQTR